MHTLIYLQRCSLYHYSYEHNAAGEAQNKNKGPVLKKITVCSEDEMLSINEEIFLLICHNIHHIL